MDLRVITPPAVEPVSLETAKAHLRVDGADDDALIASYLAAARGLCEGLARRAFVTQTLELVLDAWPGDLILALPRPPLQSVTSVKYLDADGVEHSWSDFVTDARREPGRVIFKSLPAATLFPSGAIAVCFVAGYGAAAENVPAQFGQAILMTVGHWYENREAATPAGVTAPGEVPLGARQLISDDRGSWF